MKSCSLKKNVGDVERAFCLLAGALLLFKGLWGGRALSTALGGMLAYRGFTGNCKGYEVMGIDTRSPDSRF